jgi:hypothetical protein
MICGRPHRFAWGPSGPPRAPTLTSGTNIHKTDSWLAEAEAEVGDYMDLHGFFKSLHRIQGLKIYKRVYYRVYGLSLQQFISRLLN